MGVNHILMAIADIATHGFGRWVCGGCNCNSARSRGTAYFNDAQRKATVQSAQGPPRSFFIIVVVGTHRSQPPLCRPIKITIRHIMHI